MDKETFEARIYEIEKTAKQMKTELYMEYALANNTIEIGDIVQDHMCTILVERVSPARIYSTYPEYVYYGFELKKDLTPKKNKARSTVYQSNVKNVIKQATEN